MKKRLANLYRSLAPTGAERTRRAPAPQPDKDDRLYVVGDVHGRADLLVDLLAAIVRDAAQHADRRRLRLVFLGDYVDRGDSSRATLDALLELERDLAPGTAIFLRGNHEAALLRFLESPETGAEWLDYGGRQTLASYGVDQPPLRADADELRAAAAALAGALGAHAAFLQRTRTAYRSGDVVCVHAAFDPARGWSEQSPDCALWGRGPDGPAAPDLLVVHGHYDAAEPVDTPLRICVDTGAYYSGRLTAVRLDETRRFFVVG